MINELIIAGEYRLAISEINEQIKKLPAYDWNLHWYLVQKSEAYYQLKNYKRALKYSEKAIEIAPRCPTALWAYATALFSNKDYELALYYYRLLYFKKDFKQCNEGEKWWLGIKSDCRFRIARCYFLLECTQNAKQWAKLFLKYYSPAGIISKESIELCN